jgi:hypothetical protein
MRMPSLTDTSEYVLELLREGPDFTLAAAGRAATHRRSWRWHSPQNSLRLIVSAVEHEYSLAAELDSAWMKAP